MTDLLPARSEWRSGGRVVLGATLGIATALPIWNYVSSLFTIPLTTEFGWTRGGMASAAATAFFGSLAAPFVGKIADVVGARRVLVVGLAGYACLFLALAFQPGSLVAYSVIIMFHTMVGIACGGAIFSRAVAGWFENSRGLALGVTMTGAPLGAALASPLLQWTIATHGWRSGFVMLASLAAGVGLPLVLLLVRENSRKMSAPDGEQISMTKVGADWPEIARSRSFWILACALLPITAAGTGLMSSMVPILSDGGMKTATAAALVSGFALAVIVSRLSAGWLVDRFAPHLVAAAVAAIPAAGCLLLLYANGSVVVALIALALIGVQQGAEIDLVGYLIARLFGMKNYASAYGVCVVFLGLSSAAGIAFFGRAFDVWHSYVIPIGLAVPAYLLGAALFLALGGALRRTVDGAG